MGERPPLGLGLGDDGWARGAQCGRSEPDFHPTAVERRSKSSKRTHSSRLKAQNARNDHLESSGQLGERPPLGLGPGDDGWARGAQCGRSEPDFHPTAVERRSKLSKRTPARVSRPRTRATNIKGYL